MATFTYILKLLFVYFYCSFSSFYIILISMYAFFELMNNYISLVCVILLRFFCLLFNILFLLVSLYVPSPFYFFCYGYGAIPWLHDRVPFSHCCFTIGKFVCFKCFWVQSKNDIYQDQGKRMNHSGILCPARHNLCIPCDAS